MPWIGLWSLLVLGFAFFESRIWGPLGILNIGAWLLIALLGAGILAWALIHAARRRSLAGLLTLMGGAAAAITRFFVTPRVSLVGDRWLFERHFERVKPQYERIVRQSATTPPRSGSMWREAGEIKYTVDSGPPLRVAFLQPRGIIDNWEGVVYDPSGLVRTAVGFRGSGFSAAPAILKVFGGDLVSCYPLADDFYRCWFT